MSSQRGSSPKPILIPVQVSWSVPTAVPYLKVVIDEADLCTVEFLGRFLTNEAGDHEKWVTLKFKAAGWVRSQPVLAAQGIDRLSVYDWSQVAPVYGFDPITRRPQSEDDDWINNFNEQWRRTGICPDPRMYELKESDWLTESQISKGFRHLLILGEEIQVEILCLDWRWEAGEPVVWS